MLWGLESDAAGRSRRPIVVIEDHLYHTAELVDALASAAPPLLDQLTICALDRSGPDTVAAVAELKARHPAVCMIGATQLDVASQGACARDLAKLVRPGGIVVQDVQLSTLPFIPADRWWESIYLGATIRGLFAERAPVVRFCSNKRGYDATFGKDLIEAGFDPRDVMDKTALARTVVPTIVQLFHARFPFTMRSSTSALDGAPVADADRPDIEAAHDLVLWRSAGGARLGGRLLDSTPLRAGSAEVETWTQLIEDRLDQGGGLPVVDVGQRLVGSDAERAEQTNLAARHLHGLRARLRRESAIVTAHHRYAIAPDVAVAIV